MDGFVESGAGGFSSNSSEKMSRFPPTPAMQSRVCRLQLILGELFSGAQECFQRRSLVILSSGGAIMTPTPAPDHRVESDRDHFKCASINEALSVFQNVRARLFGIAYRVLGSAA